jgi:hypothetical protein
VVYFTDADWFKGTGPDGLKRSKSLERSQALLVTCSREAKRASPDRLKRVFLQTGRPLGEPTLRMGRNSGQTAIALAAAFGAKRIVLLGFDMRFVNGRSHHHDSYKASDPKLYARDFIPHFAGWNAMAKAAKIQVLNATPGSALREFPMINIEEVLK